MKRILLIRFFLSAFPVSRAWCQNPNTPWLPVGLNGETGPLGTLTESEENELSLGVSAVGTYYDSTSSNSAIQENVGSLYGRAQHSHYRAQAADFLHPAVLTRVYLLATDGERTDQTSLDSFQYRITEKLTLQIRRTIPAHEQLVHRIGRQSDGRRPGNVIQQPNESILTTETEQTTSLSTPQSGLSSERQHR